jgi:hypothetical protein
MAKLSGALGKLDGVLLPEAKRSLAKPAAKKSLDALARDVFDGKLPAELRDWFNWHDGQTRSAPLDPKHNFTAMSSKSVRATWRMLNDPKQDCIRPRPSWVPLFENGGGDFLIYETSGAKRGALFVYWHDDAKWPRSPEYRSLAEWAGRVAKAQARLGAAKKQSPEFDLTGLRFAKIGRAPNLAALEKAEVGTVLRQELPRAISLYLRVTPERWVWHWGPRYDAAVDGLRVELRKLARSEQACDTSYVHDDLMTRIPGQKAPQLSRALARRK